MPDLPPVPPVPLESALYELLTALQAPADSLPGSETLCACVICRLGARSVERWLRTFLAEYVNDPQARENLRRAQGFCSEHTRVLSNLGEVLGIAILYADLARLARERLQQKASGRAKIPFPLRFRSPHGDKTASETSCPGCVAQEEAETRHLQALVAGLDNPHAQNQVWMALEANPGLCVSHVAQIVTQATPASAARLLHLECERLTLLQAELEEIIRKNDYRFRGETWGKEKDAWKRALDKLRKK